MLAGMLLHVIEPARPVNATVDVAERHRSINEMKHAIILAILHIEDVGVAKLSEIVGLAAQYKLPAIYGAREFVEGGGLATYGVSYPQLYFRAASFVDKIFRGAKPADLPVEQPTKLELVINLTTAKVLGLEIPAALLARADELIE